MFKGRLSHHRYLYFPYREYGKDSSFCVFEELLTFLKWLFESSLFLLLKRNAIEFVEVVDAEKFAAS